MPVELRVLCIIRFMRNCYGTMVFAVPLLVSLPTAHCDAFWSFSFQSAIWSEIFYIFLNHHKVFWKIRKIFCKLLFSWILGEIDSTFPPKIYEINFYKINLNLFSLISCLLMSLSDYKKNPHQCALCTCQSQITFFTRDPSENYPTPLRNKLLCQLFMALR